MTKMRRFYTNELFHEFLFFSLALICMLIFAFIQPFGEGPDEINRFRVVRFIYENGRLPKGDDPAVLIPGYGGSICLSANAYLHIGWIPAARCPCIYGTL